MLSIENGVEVEDSGYRGNKNLRKSGIKQSWTKDEITEYIKCKKDPIHFIKNYVKITHVDDGIVPFKLWKFQEKLVKDLHNNRFTIGLWPRQSGKSTTIASYMLHFILFNSNKNCAILANKAMLAREILNRIQMMYELLPFWLKHGIKDWNKGSITFENGSKIIAAATSSSAIRGLSISFLLLDEFAFIPKNMAEDFFRSVYPTVTSGKKTKIAIISTPFGMNHYYKMWNEANIKEGHNGYKANRAFWSDVPGRNEKWKQETIRNIGQEAFDQEYGCEFLGSAGTLISADALRSMTYKNPIFENANGFKMYKVPEEGKNYIMTVDTSEGLGKDSHAIGIFNASKPPYEQVAVYKNSRLDPQLLPDIIYNLANNYNEAYVLLELNSMGLEVAHILQQDLEYENILYTTMSGRKGQILGGGKGVAQIGLKTTSQSKRVGCSLLKSLIESNQLIINDFDTYQEFTTFIRDKNTYNAEEGYNDDLVTCCRLFAWITGQTFFKEEMEHDFRMNINRSQVEMLEDDLVPFGIIDNGVPTENIHDRINDHLSNTW